MSGWTRIVSACFGVLVACGGNAAEGPGGAGAGAGAFAGGSAGNSATFGGGGSLGGARGGGGSLGGSSGGAPFTEPSCPTVEPPPGIVECDPLASVSGCAAGMSCYPYVQHPFGEGCDAETFGAVCIPSGTGTQGALCGEGTEACAAGYICVIGAHAGKRCAKLCAFRGGDECPVGLICGDTDIEGYGVCD
ncbi:MAG: hypothetical protein QM756_17930 [Polyangiaceae bacterium]